MLYSVCPTCHMLLADKQLPFETEKDKILNNTSYDEKKKQKEIESLLNKLGCERYCCRTRIISYMDQVHLII